MPVRSLCYDLQLLTMPTPSLLIVPARFKSGKLYSQIPTSGAGDFTVTRATAATRVNASGFIESVASGIPRLDYFASGGTAGCPALLVEPAATNLVPSGTNVGGEAGVSRTATTTSPAVDISGTIIAKTVTGTTNLYASQTCLTSLPASSTIYTISRFFKYNGTDLTTSLENNNSTQWGGTSWSQRVVISAASGVTLGASTACTGSVENYGNGWYRVSARFTTGATPSGSTTVNYLMLVSGSVASGSSFLTALPQLETGSVATSYIPTTTGSVTRNADVVSVSGAVSGSIGQTEGTIYAEVDLTNQAAVRTIFTLSDNSAINRIRIRRTNATTVDAERSVSGSGNVSLTITIPSSGIIKIAIGYSTAASGYIAFVNGSQAAVNASAISMFTSQLSQINVGSNFDGTAIFNDRIRAAALYTTRLTNAQLAALTTP